MARSILAKNALFFLGLCILICTAYSQKLLYSGMESEVTKHMFQCYDCNSEYDPRCADPFNPYSIGIVNCTEKKMPEQLRDIEHPDRQLVPSICRKTIQKIDGKKRVIRGCGYIKDRHDDKRCFRRSGTAAVEVHYCSCTKSMCNTAKSIHLTNLAVLLLVIITKIM